MSDETNETATADPPGTVPEHPEKIPEVSPDAELTAPPPDPEPPVKPEPEPAPPEPEPVPLVPVLAQPLPIVEPAPEQPFKVVAGVNFSIGSGGSVAKL